MYKCSAGMLPLDLIYLSYFPSNIMFYLLFIFKMKIVSNQGGMGYFDKSMWMKGNDV